MLSITREVLLDELDAAKAIIDRWHKTIEAGIPVIDMPAPEDRLELFVRQLCGELLLVSGKCQSIAEILGNDLG